MSEKLDMVSMQILLHAGNARALLKEALELVASGQLATAEERIDAAAKEKTVAHETQTDIIQQTADGGEEEYSILFCHAQDTLMTVASELMIAKQLLAIYRGLDQRLKQLEGRA